MSRGGAAITVGDGPLPPGILMIRRSTPRLIASILRDPRTAVPAPCRQARMVLTRNLGRLRAYITDPALIHEALVRNADSLAKSAEMKRVLGPALGDGLLTADGASWRHQRQALAPAFRHDRLTGLVPAMIAAAEATRDRWLALSPGARIDLGHEMMRTTFQIIVETMLSGADGIDAAEVERCLADVFGATTWMFAMAILRAPRWVPFPGGRRAVAATGLMRETVRRRVAARRHGDMPGGDDLIAMLLAARDPETGAGMDDEAITDNILTFIAAGHETTAVALGWTFSLLARNPDCAARLRAEIAAVTGGGPVAPRHISALVYTRQVIEEAMRLYPPAALIARAVVRDIMVGGVDLPAGSIVFVPIEAIHRHDSLWAAPDIFDPDRFAPDAARARPRHAYMPFGAGPRVCIGTSFATMEAVAILAVLAKAVTLAHDGPPPDARMRVTLRPARPLTMRVSRAAAV